MQPMRSRSYHLQLLLATALSEIPGQRLVEVARQQAGRAVGLFPEAPEKGHQKGKLRFSGELASQETTDIFQRYVCSAEKAEWVVSSSLFRKAGSRLSALPLSEDILKGAGLAEKK